MRSLRTTLLIASALLTSIPLSQLVQAQATAESGSGFGMEMGTDPLPQEILILKGPGDPSPERGMLQTLTVFSYPLGSLKPVLANERPQGNASESTDMGDPRQAADLAVPTIEIYAAVLEPEGSASQGSLELLVPAQQVFRPRRLTGRGDRTHMGGGEMSGFGGYGGAMGGEGGYGGMEGSMMGGGEMGGGMMGDMGMGGTGFPMGLHTSLVRLETLSVPAPADAANTSEVSRVQLPPEEVQFVSRIIRQSLRRRELLAELGRSLDDSAAVERLEEALKKLLTEEYETQLQRQEIEIANIEQRTRQLRDELQRRRAAKERVVDVQLGRIVLEAQGLLGR